MLIEIEATPNPATLRFLLPRSLPLSEPIAFERGDDPRPRLAERLLGIVGVRDILLARDFVAVSRTADAPDWPGLQPDVVLALIAGLDEGDDAELAAWAAPAPAEHDAVEQQIAEILRTRIAPAVARDGGSITLVSYRDRVATVEMRGACGGCPSALMTLKRGVETTLKRYVPELERVEAVRDAGGQHEPFWKKMLRARGGRFRNASS
jgi:Fe-S cluster biogenesis protein NfuA